MKEKKATLKFVENGAVIKLPSGKIVNLPNASDGSNVLLDALGIKKSSEKKDIQHEN